MTAYFDTGFSVRQTPWHGLGNVPDHYPADWNEARVWAGLEWDPIAIPVYTRTTILADAPRPDGTIVVGTVDGGAFLDVMTPAPSHQAISRSDNGLVLGVPSDKFAVITNGDLGDIVEGVLGTDSAVKFETAGSLHEGRNVWALVMLDEPIDLNRKGRRSMLKADSSLVFPFLAIVNSHDGSGACKVMLTYVRIVCWNTWSAADMLGEKTGLQVSIRHTGNVMDRIEDAKAMLARARAGRDEYAIAAEDLLSINVSDGLVKQFLSEFIPIPENASPHLLTQRQERQSMFLKLYNESMTTDDIRGTAYGLVQAAGEYLDHMRPFKSRDTYLARTMLRPEPIKSNAVKLIRELAAAAN